MWGFYDRKKPKNNDTSVSFIRLSPHVKEGEQGAAPPPPKECEVPKGIELPGLLFAKLAITDPMSELTAADLGMVNGPFSPDHKIINLEIKGAQAFLTLRTGVAMLGKKTLRVGSCVTLPELSKLDFYMPKNWEEMKKDIMPSAEEKKDDEEKSAAAEEKMDEEKSAAAEEKKDEEKPDDVEEKKDEEKAAEDKKDETKMEDEKGKDEDQDKKKKDKKKKDKKSSDNDDDLKDEDLVCVASYAILVEDSDPRKLDNYLFYKGTGKSRPDRCTVANFHDSWWGDYGRLEYEHVSSNGCSLSS